MLCPNVSCKQICCNEVILYLLTSSWLLITRAITLHLVTPQSAIRPSLLDYNMDEVGAVCLHHSIGTTCSNVVHLFSAAMWLDADSRYYNTRLPKQLVYCRIPAMSCHSSHLIQRARKESHLKWLPLQLKKLSAQNLLCTFLEEQIIGTVQIDSMFAFSVPLPWRMI